MPTRDEPVYVRVEGEHILGTLISPGSLVPGVLFVHGWGGDQRQYLARAREVAGLGCVCLTFDLRGHAQTQAQYESVSREESLRDVLAAYDFLAAQHNVDSDAMAVVGSSFGMTTPSCRLKHGTQMLAVASTFTLFRAGAGPTVSQL